MLEKSHKHQMKQIIWRLFRKILREIPKDTVQTYLSEPEIELLASPYFLELLKKHRITNMMYDTIVQMLPPNCDTDKLHQLKNLKQRSYRNAKKYLLQQHAEQKILNELHQHSIPHLPLKGCTIQKRLFNTESVREMKDIDILITKDKVIEAHQILTKMGYRSLEGDLSMLKPSRLELLQLAQKDCTYTSHDGSIKIELHWRLHNVRLIDTDRYFSSLGSIRLSLSTEDQFIYLMMHAALHSWFRLKHLVDLAKFSACKTLNWLTIKRNIKNNKQIKVYRELQSLLKQYFDIQTPILFNNKTNRHRFRLAFIDWRFRRKAKNRAGIKRKLVNMGVLLFGTNNLSTSQKLKIYYSHLLLVIHNTLYKNKTIERDNAV